MSPSLDDDLDTLCGTTESAPSNTLTLVTLELSLEFKQWVLHGYQTDTKASMIIHTLQEASEETQDTRMPYYMEDGLLYQQPVTGEAQLFIPQDLISDLFKLIHDNAGHQGFDHCMKGLQLFTVHYSSHLLKKYIQHCLECQQNGVQHHLPYSTLQPIITPAVPFNTITIDFILGLPKLPNGHDCTMSATCKYSKALTLLAGKETDTASDWALRFVHFLMTADWGFPNVIISDHDQKFLSELWQTMFQLLKVELHFMTAYHPQADRQSEQINQTAEIMIQHITQTNPEADWESILLQVQYQLNGSENASTGQTPHWLLYGMHLH